MMNVPLPSNRIKKMMSGSIGVPNNIPTKLASNSPSKHGLKQLTLSEFLQPMVMAMTQKQPWIEDFGNDQIILPADLYEVIKAYSGMQNPGASKNQNPSKKQDSD